MVARRVRLMYCRPAVRSLPLASVPGAWFEPWCGGHAQVLVGARRSPAGLGRLSGLWAWDSGAPPREARPTDLAARSGYETQVLWHARLRARV